MHSDQPQSKWSTAELLRAMGDVGVRGLGEVLRFWLSALGKVERDLKFLILWASCVLVILAVIVAFMLADLMVALWQERSPEYFLYCLSGVLGCGFILMPVGLVVMLKIGRAAPSLALEDGFDRVVAERERQMRRGRLEPEVS